MRPGDRERGLRGQRRGRPQRDREALASRSSGSVHTSSVGGDRPRQAAAAPPTRAAVHRRPARDRLHQLQARGRGRGAAPRRPGPAGRIVNPSFVLGPDDPKGTSMDAGAPLSARRIPVYIDGGLNIVDVRDVAEGHLLADEKGEAGERYILGGRNFTLQRLFADLARIAGRGAAAGEAPGRAHDASPWSAMARAGLPVPVSPDEVRSGTLWWTYRNTKAQRELGFRRDPTRRRSRTPSVAAGAARRPRQDRARAAARRPLARLRPAAAAGTGGCSDGEREARSSSTAAGRRPTCSARAVRSRGGWQARARVPHRARCLPALPTGRRSSS